MTKIQDTLKNLTERFKKVSIPDPDRIEKMKKVAEAAKKVSQEIKEQKG